MTARSKPTTKTPGRATAKRPRTKSAQKSRKITNKPTRPQRTRAHVIAELSVNHVAYHILKAGFTLNVDAQDYGYDGHMSTFDSLGGAETGVCYVQLKATDDLKKLVRKPGQISYTIDKEHLVLWDGDLYPACLVIFDAVAEKAYWLDVQAYLSSMKIDVTKMTTATKTLHIPLTNVFDSGTPLVWRQEKEIRTSTLLKALKRA